MPKSKKRDYIILAGITNNNNDFNNYVFNNVHENAYIYNCVNIFTTMC